MFLEDFRTADQNLEIERKYHEDSGKTMMYKWSILMHEIFDFIKNKKMFKHEILKEEKFKIYFRYNR